ncbi:unnamed protein product, partial [Iphiclides podalirius]
MASLHFTFLFIGFIAVSLRHVRAFTAEEVEAIKLGLRPLIAECAKEFDIDMEEIKKARESNNMESLDPCLFACFGKKIGVINGKGDFDTEKATGLAKTFVKDEEELKKALETVEKCSSVNEETSSDDKGCGKALLLYKCFSSYKEQLGFSR